MTCSVPGCPNGPAGEAVRVKATPATEIEPRSRAVALTALCPAHRREFEALGWLAPEAEPEVSAGTS